ncbi:MAG TPA: hypothetical protein DEB39_12625 [Planctomycetaceae bacterium]|nr:hypothetical protein [Planctomycetaceae bacterium]
MRTICPPSFFLPAFLLAAFALGENTIPTPDPVNTPVNKPTLAGPVRSEIGHLIVFETDRFADWTVAPLDSGTGNWSVDTSGTRLYFASSRQGVFTILAAVVVEGKPHLLSTLFYNGTPLPGPGPEPKPEPSPDTLLGWVRTASSAVSSTHREAERTAIADCLAVIVAGIDRRTIKSPQGARTLFRQCWNAKGVAVSPESLANWSGFLDELGERIEAELGAKKNDMVAIRNLYAEIAASLKKE